MHGSQLSAQLFATAAKRPSTLTQMTTLFGAQTLLSVQKNLPHLLTPQTPLSESGPTATNAVVHNFYGEKLRNELSLTCTRTASNRIDLGDK